MKLNFFKKFKTSNFLLALMSLIVGIVIFSPSVAHAAPTKVDPNDTKFADKNNSLLFATDAAHSRALQSVTSSNSSLKVTEETSQGRDHKVIYWANLNDLKKTDTITITYGEVGFYAGKKVKAQIVLSDFIVGQNYFGTTVAGKKNYIHINYDLPQGFTTSGIRNCTAVMKLTYADTGAAVDLSGDSYISMSSLNGNKELGAGLGEMREFVSYEKMSSLPYYVTKTTAIGEYTNPVTKSGKVIGGITNPETDKNFEDKVGAKTFTNATVSFQVKGTNPKFIMGATYGTQWIAFNASTLWSVKPDDPTKVVTNSSGTNYNGKTVKVGDTLIYKVSQKTNTLNQDLLTKYTKFVIGDPLPKEVDYVKSHVETTGNTKFDASGEIKYDSGTHTVVYTANSNTLQNRIGYNGEAYTLVIETKVNNKVKEGVDIVDKGYSIINSNEAETNKVVNYPPIAPEITKKIVQNGKEVDQANINYDDYIDYKVKVKLPNPSDDAKFIVTDDVEDVLDLDVSSIKFFDSSNKEVTNIGTLATDPDTEKWTWTVDNNDSTRGKVFFVTFRAKIKIDYENFEQYLDNDGNIVIPNEATLNTLTSNKVTVIPELPPMNISTPRTGSTHTMIIAGAGILLLTLASSIYLYEKKKA